MITYVTNQRLLKDAEEWATTLPHFDAFIGVPRGGALIASMLACRRNAKLLSLDHLARYREDSLKVPQFHATHQTPLNHTGAGTILLVDDNVSAEANTFQRIKKHLGTFDFGKMKVKTATMYRSDPRTPVDYYFADMTPAPIFEFDWFRRGYVQYIGFDLDGVLCEDYGPPEKEHPDPEHLRHVDHARCLLVPRDPVKAIVTSRLSIHRAATEKWLARHNIRYQELITYDSASADERRRRKDNWRHKADFLSRSDVWFFAESCPVQSKCIFEKTGKPVLCTVTGQMFQ
jgi:uncharacterized HAD superfamily protein/hypoxanthine phosphoribosyltransferase